jgi:hypothetical protein
MQSFYVGAPLNDLKGQRFAAFALSGTHNDLHHRQKMNHYRRPVSGEEFTGKNKTGGGV